ncbi:MAG: radical SAM protein [Candidatus Aenigmarchaeota archaeon]|nr:radical SAM protein [Candidatus Aenigmarchaeota archaeon]
MSSDNKYEIGKVEILLGWVCNNNCMFCSVGHKLPEKSIKSWETVKKHIDYGKEVKSDTISFSGGEPTIMNYLEKAVKYSKSLGFKTIEIQSNGRMFSYPDFAEKIVKAGANRFLISLHADSPELGDAINRVKGSFNQTIEGVKNLNKLGTENLRFSLVMNKLNYKRLDKICEFLLQFNPVGIHTNYTIIDGHAYSNKENIMPPKMSIVAPYVYKAIKVVRSAEKEIWVYSFPHCLMQGYEFTIAEAGSMDSRLIGPDFDISLQENRHKHREQKGSCNTCKYRKLCLGPWKRYVKLFGFDEFKPVEGDVIEDPSVFMSQGYKF